MKLLYPNKKEGADFKARWLLLWWQFTRTTILSSLDEDMESMDCLCKAIGTSDTDSKHFIFFLTYELDQ